MKKKPISTNTNKVMLIPSSKINFCITINLPKANPNQIIIQVETYKNPTETFSIDDIIV
ncbi:hypothetical protein [Mycoplasma mycoides]|uniref:hypothetical protein n=1 Tax=Mycoplasma mycoides TaxID=2102 RepID=UPI00223F01B2|nr:hypothetical protein [Mycoplasma mycoides]QVK09168.1 hypothetical protein I7615_03520 [Mycoplasma mycoides subsp. capri]